MRKYIFAQESLYLQGILISMNSTHPFLTVNTNVCLPIEFHVFTIRINSRGYHSLVPGLISIFLETVWVPLKMKRKIINIMLIYVYMYMIGSR